MPDTISETLNQLLARQPPESLYHYTTGPGFLGIVESKEIWATSIHYMNDAKEFSLALEGAYSRLQTVRGEVNLGDELGLLDRMVEDLERVEQVNICLASFSELPDQLSQWRAYAGDYGFSVGLRSERLRDVAGEQGFFLAPCIYNYQAQEKIVAEIINFHIEEFRRQLIEQPDTAVDTLRNDVSWQFVNRLARHAPILKHASFAEECEWRLISNPTQIDHPQMAYRSGRSMIVPYFRVRFYRANDPLDLGAVTVGPTPHPKQARTAVSNVLVKHGVTGWTVKATSTPYRNW